MERLGPSEAWIVLCLAIGAGCGPHATSTTGGTSASSSGSGGTCTAACSLGEHACVADAVKVCVDVGGCPKWAAPTACAPSETCDAGACVAKPPPCAGMPGSFHDQAFPSGGETRHYFLHVPPDYQCGQAWPLLVDFHGTGFGGPADTVEESWAFPEMLEASDSEHFIVVRPRSRSSPFNGQYVYQWDINPGDLGLNHDYAVALVADLASRYHVDPSRVYALGFSNGPTMAAQFLADDPSIMRGYAAISGGLNSPLAGGPSLDGPTAPRVYEMTGFRDYMGVAQRNLNAYLDAHTLSSDHVFQRQADTGHELYGWHYHEAFRWMDQGTRPAKGTLKAGWVADPGSSATESLVQAARDPQGGIHLVGTGGAIYRRPMAASSWTQTAALSAGGVALPFADVCFQPSGVGFAAGDGWVAKTTDGASWTVLPRVPEFGSMQFGYTHVTSLGCSAGQVLAAGVWSAASTSNVAASWSAVSLGGTPPFFTQVRQLPSGTWLGIGYYDAIVRSTDGASFTTIAPPADLQWLNGLASSAGGKVWIVGEKGTIFASTDDGASFVTQQAPGIEDLYAVAFADDGLHGLAVGAHGAAYATTDGGATWTDKSTGLDGFLGDVLFTSSNTALVVGESGAVLTTQL